MLPYVYGPYIFFRPCVCAENRGKNIKKKIFFFLLWRLARDAAVRVVVVGCCAQRLFPQPLTPWKPGVTHAHVLCDKLAFCCCCRLLLCCFPSQTILYFFFQQIGYFIELLKQQEVAPDFSPKNRHRRLACVIILA